MKKLRLGIIGMSEGNGHPYSWSAICNGYDALIMADCPFPVILEYLAKQKFPEAAIADVNVTHIWTQDNHLSKHIAAAAFIPNVVDQMEQMIPEIDAVLLARDDAERHIEMARPFIKAGLPIYIDKPMALTRKEADELYGLQQYAGQIFTCSALQFSHEFSLKEDNKEAIGKISHIDAYIKKDWNKYAIHLIEPIVKILGADINIIDVDVVASSSKTIAHYLFENGITVALKTFQDVNVKPTINVLGNKGRICLEFNDTFAAFKAALEKFVEGVRDKTEIIRKDYVMRCIEMIERVNEKSSAH